MSWHMWAWVGICASWAFWALLVFWPFPKKRERLPEPSGSCRRNGPEAAP